MIGLVLLVGGSFVMLWVHDDFIEPFQAIWGIFVLVAFACLHLYVGWKRCDTRAWQVAVLSVWLAPILPVTLPWAVIDDVKRRRIRHWTHWFGVALFAAGVILSLVGVIRDEYF